MQANFINFTVEELLSNNTVWDDLTQEQKGKARDVTWNKSSWKRELENRACAIPMLPISRTGSLTIDDIVLEGKIEDKFDKIEVKLALYSYSYSSPSLQGMG